MAAVFTASVMRLTSGRVGWRVSRSRWGTPGTATLSAVVAEGSLDNLVVPAGTPVSQAIAIYEAVLCALREYEDQGLAELDAKP